LNDVFAFKTILFLLIIIVLHFNLVIVKCVFIYDKILKYKD
jgi:hypothetical protein